MLVELFERRRFGDFRGLGVEGLEFRVSGFGGFIFFLVWYRWIPSAYYVQRPQT